MDTLDIVLIVLIAAFALRGFWRGLYFEVMSVVAVVVAIAAAIRFAPPAAQWLIDSLSVPTAVAPTVGFFSVFFPGLAAMRLVRMIGRRMLPDQGDSPLNAVGGLFIGAFKGALLIGTVLALLSTPVAASDVAYREVLGDKVFSPIEKFQFRLRESELAMGLSGMSMGFFSFLVDTKAALVPDTDTDPRQGADS